MSSSSDDEKGVTVHYSTSAQWPSSPLRRRRRIIILDSSFNPPQLAHRSLLLSASSSSEQEEDEESYCLLLSTSNADKGSAGTEEVSKRIGLMRAMARGLESESELESTLEGEGKRTTTRKKKRDMAVVTVEPPFFVAKAKLLRTYLDLQQSSSDPTCQEEKEELVFPMGWDTLIRFFNPKYYPPGPGGGGQRAAMRSFFIESNASIICARRPASGGSSEEPIEEEEEQEFLESEDVREWRDRVGMVDLEEGGLGGVSSTKVREAIKRAAAAAAAVVEGEEAGTKEERVRKALEGWVMKEVGEEIVKKGWYR